MFKYHHLAVKIKNDLFLTYFAQLNIDGVFDFAPFVSKQSNKQHHLAVNIKNVQLTYFASQKLHWEFCNRTRNCIMLHCVPTRGYIARNRRDGQTAISNIQPENLNKLLFRHPQLQSMPLLVGSMCCAALANKKLLYQLPNIRKTQGHKMTNRL